MSHNVTHQPAYVSLRQAADYLGYESERTIRRMIAEGHLRAYRVGTKTVRIKVSDLDKAMQPIPAAGGGSVA